MKLLLSIASFLLSLSLLAQLNPQPKKITEKFFPDPDIEINTPAFQKERGFTDYEEMMSFLNNLQQKHADLMSISFIGESQKGKEIPMVLLTKKGVKDPIRVWIQGGLHGNEPGSSESTFYIIQQVLENKELTKYLDRLQIAVVPMANIDGYERNYRYAINGIDLNRDQTKLNAPESVSLKQAFSNYNAEVALDLHEYNAYRKDFTQLGKFGISSIYDAMFLYTGNLNVPEDLRNYTKDVFVANAGKVLDENKLRYDAYMSTTKHDGDIHFRKGAVSARSSASSYALTNCVSTLIEVRGVHLKRTSFKRRVNTSFLIATSYLKTAYEDGENLRAEIAKAIEVKNNAVIESKRSVYEDSIPVINMDTYSEMILKVTMRDGLQSILVNERERPFAYIIPANEEAIINRLKTLGLELNPLKEDKEIEVESYIIKKYRRNAVKYEKVNMQKVKAETSTKEAVFPKGTLVLLMDQKASNLAIEVLEPEAANSFVAFNVVPTTLNETLPYYRCMLDSIEQSIEKNHSNE